MKAGELIKQTVTRELPIWIAVKSKELTAEKLNKRTACKMNKQSACKLIKRTVVKLNERVCIVGRWNERTVCTLTTPTSTKLIKWTVNRWQNDRMNGCRAQRANHRQAEKAKSCRANSCRDSRLSYYWGPTLTRSIFIHGIMKIWTNKSGFDVSIRVTMNR